MKKKSFCSTPTFRTYGRILLTGSLPLVFASLATNAEARVSSPATPERTMTGLTLENLQAHKPHFELLQGTTTKIASDFVGNTMPATFAPDRSFKTLWVRMFPLLTTPYGDPYPPTQDTDALEITNEGDAKVFSLKDGRTIGVGRKIVFAFDKGRFEIDGARFVLEPLWITPTDSNLTTLSWDKAKKTSDGTSAEVRVKLRGGFVVQPSRITPRLTSTKDRLKFNASPEVSTNTNERILWSAINVVDINDYLMAVVPSEVIASWLPTTLETQAIAARTYALWEAAAARQQGQDWDMDPSTWYQSYQGVEIWGRSSGSWRKVEQASTSAAVRATGNEVITHNGEVIKAYFSANSGGHSCMPLECIEQPNQPYFHIVDDAPGILDAPGGTWGTKANITSAGITEQLASLGIKPRSSPTRIDHLRKGESGRTWQIRVVLKDGSSIDLDRTQSRRIMRLFGAVRSYLYKLGTVDRSTGKQHIQGHGYGHGVGLSQYGTQLFAKAGWTSHRILRHYYKDVKVEDLSMTRQLSGD